MMNAETKSGCFLHFPEKIKRDATLYL